ncbi:MAG: glycosyltransferase family protein [Steroidobacteraceae bacterium]
MSRTVALIQARMSSSRYPGKVLELLGNLPMIVFMVRRVRRARTLQDVIVVTSVDKSDDALAALLMTHDIHCFRGELHDVLARYSVAAASSGATEIVRLTGDCPLTDPAVIDQVVRARRDANADYASNVDPRTFADGLDVECFTRAVLDRATSEASEPAQREHVTLWMREAAAGLRRTNVRAVADSSPLRLTVDYPADLTAIRRLVELIGRLPDEFDMFDMLRCIAAHPEITAMNAAMNAAMNRLETT